jgi:hypothetical protein
MHGGWVENFPSTQGAGQALPESGWDL